MKIPEVSGANPPELEGGPAVWNPPPELTLATPRHVDITFGGAFYWACGAVIFAFCALILAWFADALVEGIMRDPHQVGVFLFGVAIFLAVAFLIGWYFLRPSLERKLLKWGQPARAVITKVRWQPSNYGPSYSVKFEFLDGAGKSFLGSADWFYSRKPDSGEVQTILFDPRNPRRSALYPARGYRIKEPKQGG